MHLNPRGQAEVWSGGKHDVTAPDIVEQVLFNDNSLVMDSKLTMLHKEDHVFSTSDNAMGVSELSTQTMSRLIAANQSLSPNYPVGLPEGLLIRGTGQSLARTLDGLGEPVGNLAGHVALVTNHDQEIMGPQFLLRGPQIEFACKPKQIWNEGTKVSDDNVETLINDLTYVCCRATASS